MPYRPLKDQTRLLDMISEGKLDVFSVQTYVFCYISMGFLHIFSAYDYVVPARGKELIKTDLQIELPHGCYGRIAPRSGLAWKNFIDVGGV